MTNTKEIKKNVQAEDAAAKQDKIALEAVFILDASGSMQPMTQDTIGGFNSLLAEQRSKAGSGRVLISTVSFNDVSRVLHDRIDVDKVPELTEADYRPYGTTALMDALGDAIRHIEIIHKYARPEDVPAKTVFLITTDGMENASRRYGSDQIRQMIGKKQEEGWEFVFVAANIDAVETAARYGIREDRAVGYRNDSVGNAKKFRAMSYIMKDLACCKSIDDSWRAELDEDNKGRK